MKLLKKWKGYSTVRYLFALLYFAFNPILRSEDSSKNIINHTKLTPKHFDKAIKEGEYLGREFIKQYNIIVNEKIVPVYRDSFEFRTGQFKTIMVISESSESYIEFQPSAKSEYDIYITMLPAQSKLLIGKDTPDRRIMYGNGLRAMDDLKLFLDYYNKTGLLGVHGDGENYFSGGVQRIDNRLFNLWESDVVILYDNVEFVFYDKNDSIQTLIKYVGLLSGAKSFGNIRKNIYAAAAALVDAKIQYLNFSSRFFKKAQAEPKLQPLAGEMAEKQYRCDVLKEIEYPPSQREIDFNRLIDLAQKNGIADSLFPKIIIDYEKNRVKGGIFIWYYNSNSYFLFQWLILNLFFLGLLIFLFLIKTNNSFLIKTINIIFFGLNAGGNYWAFTSRPLAYPILFNIIPGLLFIINSILSKYIDKKYKKS